MLQDTTGRGIGYLRLSLTKACSMRCTYCRPEKLEHPKGEPVLSPVEIEQLTRYLVDRYGVYKVRLTGGDPTSRRELVEIIERVARIDGVRDVSMTTNGLTLVKQARDYVNAGLNRVNVSLDSLDAERFARMTGVDGLERVLDGLDAARDAGLSPVKLNTVVLRGENDAELADLVRFSAERDMPIRFIELMPMGPLASTWSQRYVTESEMRERIAPIVRTWAPLPQGPDAARRFDVVLDSGVVARIGFITPMSCNFCADCNRLRIAADGAVFPCLMDQPRGTLLDALRPVFDGPAVDRVLEDAYAAKQPEHPHDGFVVMTHIGG